MCVLRHLLAQFSPPAFPWGPVPLLTLFRSEKPPPTLPRPTPPHLIPTLSDVSIASVACGLQMLLELQAESPRLAGLLTVQETGKPEAGGLPGRVSRGSHGERVLACGCLAWASHPATLDVQMPTPVALHTPFWPQSQSPVSMDCSREDLPHLSGVTRTARVPLGAAQGQGDLRAWLSPPARGQGCLIV